MKAEVNSKPPILFPAYPYLSEVSCTSTEAEKESKRQPEADKELGVVVLMVACNTRYDIPLSVFPEYPRDTDGMD